MTGLNNFNKVIPNINLVLVDGDQDNNIQIHNVDKYTTQEPLNQIISLDGSGTSNDPDVGSVQVDALVQMVIERTGSLPAKDKVAVADASEAHLLNIMQENESKYDSKQVNIQIVNVKSEAHRHISMANTAANKAHEQIVCEMVQKMLTQPIGSLISSEAPIVADIKNKATNDTITPQLYRRQDGGYNLLRAVPPIENLILPGGGAKGIGLAGALLEMKNAGMLDNLRAVAGSSAGALVATWLSVGRSIPELGILLSGDFRNLLKTDKSLNFLYPDIQFKSTAAFTATILKPFGANHDTATGMIKKLDEVTSEAVRGYIASQLPEELLRRTQVYMDDKIDRMIANGTFKGDTADREQIVAVSVTKMMDRLNILKEPLDFSKSRLGKMITFADLEFLSTIAPEQFKSLRITAHNLAEHEHIILDYDTAPSLPIAYAARASMAHPLIATGVSFPAYSWEKASHVYADGGISTNVPVEAIIPMTIPTSAKGNVPTPAYQRLRAATAIVAFDNEGEAEQVMSKSPQSEWDNRGVFSRIKDSIVYGVMGWVASNSDMAQDNLADRQKIHDFGANAFVVKHGDLSALDVDASCKRKAEAIKLARLSLHEQLKIARGDSYAVEVSSVQEAFSVLDPAEKASLLKGQNHMLTTADKITPQHELQMLAMAEQMKAQAGQVRLMM